MESVKVVLLKTGDTVVYTERVIDNNDRLDRIVVRPVAVQTTEEGMKLVPFFPLIDMNRELRFNEDSYVFQGFASQEVISAYNQYWSNANV